MIWNQDQDFSVVTRRSAASGLTLIEVLIVVVILAILGGLAMIGLRSMMDRRDAIVCLSHLNSLGMTVTIYGADNRDSFPSWITRGVNYEHRPELWGSFGAQAYTVMEDQRWLDAIGFEPANDIMYCPANQYHPEYFDRAASPDYIVTAAAYARSSHLRPNLPASDAIARLGGAVQRIGSAAFPASKAGLFEFRVWHGWRGSAGVGADYSTLDYWQSAMPGSVWFVDGHAAQMYEDDAIPPVFRYPIWPFMTFGTTPWGMQGRDIQ